jgi:hypothetical protein
MAKAERSGWCQVLAVSAKEVIREDLLSTLPSKKLL